MHVRLGLAIPPPLSSTVQKEKHKKKHILLTHHRIGALVASFCIMPYSRALRDPKTVTLAPRLSSAVLLGRADQRRENVTASDGATIASTQHETNKSLLLVSSSLCRTTSIQQSPSNQTSSRTNRRKVRPATGPARRFSVFESGTTMTAAYKLALVVALYFPHHLRRPTA